MAVCTSCMGTFLSNPYKVGLVAASLLLAVFFLFLVKRNRTNINRKLAYMYAHIFFLVFPFIFYIFFRGCTAFFSHCEKAKAVGVMLLLTAMVAIVLGLIIAPFLLIKTYIKKSIVDDNALSAFVSKKSRLLEIAEPKLYFLDIAKPIAFSFNIIRAKVFISIGLVELLSRKEAEAVLLHELGHIKNKTPLFKFSAFLMRVISPIAHFTSFNAELSNEEHRADDTAYEMQGTGKHILSAKRKINEYGRLD